MFLANPFWLLLALAGLGVLYLHVRRRKTFTVPSVLIWQRIASGRATRRPWRLPPWSLALALQLLVVALLALALAEPMFSGQGTSRVLIVDATALPASADAARRELSTFPPDARNPVSIVAAGPAPRLVVARGTDAAAVQQSLGWIAAQDGAVDTARSQELAASVADKDTAIAWIEGDGQASIEATIAQDGQSWQVRGRITAPEGAPLPGTAKVLFMPEGTPGFLDWADMPVAADGGFDFSLDLPGAGIVSIRTEQTGARFAVRPAAQESRVLYLGKPTPAIVRAMQAVHGIKLFEADTLPADDGTFDLVVIDNTTIARAPATNTLWVGSAHLESEPAPDAIEAESLTAWQPDHALSQGVDWTALHTIVGFTAPAGNGASVLAAIGDRPLVIARTTRAGRDIRLGLDMAATPWADDPSYLALMVNMLRWSGLAQPAGMEQPCLVGQPCAIPPRALAGTIMPVEEAVISRSENQSQPLLPVGAFAEDGTLAEGLDSFVPQHSGLYRIDDATGRQSFIAVNTPRIAAVSGESASTPELAAPTAALPALWWLLAGLGLVVFAAEFALTTLRGENPFVPREDARFLQGRVLMVVLALTGLFFLFALFNLPFPQLSEGRRVAVASTEAAAETLVPGAVPVSMGDADRPGGAAGDALMQAAASIPAGTNGRILLDWNGNETRPGLPQAVEALAARAIPVDLLATETPGKLSIDHLTAPARIFTGDAVTLNAMVMSDGIRAADITITRNGEPLGTSQMTLQPGSNRVETLIRADAEGPAFYALRIAAGQDTVEAGLWIDAAASPHIAVFAGKDADPTALTQALGLQGFNVEQLSPSRAPSSPAGWNKYDAVVLLDMPATDLAPRQQEQLEQAVRNDGLELLILGGPHSFGPGGYFETPLEAVSPLSSRVPRNAPKTGFVFVLDRSGSMNRDEGGMDRLTIAKAATFNAAGLLNPQSQVGIVAFDTASHVILPLQNAGDESSIRNALNQLDADGGTAVYPALRDAIDMLRPVDLPKRHIVVISDGLTQPGDFAGLLAEARQAGITVSAIAIGDAADPTSLSDIAKLGGGAFHWSRDFRALPGILAQEALLSSSSPIEERTVTPQWVNRADAFLAAAPANVPAIDGYVDTTAKSRAHLHLATTDAEGNVVPIMASWRYGAGQVLALATQATGAWTARWSALPDYPRFWAQIVRGLLHNPQGLPLEAERIGDEVRLAVSSEVAPQVTVTGANGIAAPQRLVEREPGRWTARFPVLANGDFIIAADNGTESAERRIHVAGPAIAALSGADRSKAEAVARMTGGSVLSDAAQFAQPAARWVLASGWRLWLLLAAALFMASLALRYLPGLVSSRRVQTISAAPPLRRAA